jgi:hypothetical protein
VGALAAHPSATGSRSKALRGSPEPARRGTIHPSGSASGTRGVALNFCQRDTGLFRGFLEALAASGAGGARVQMIDSIVIRTHRHSAGAMKGWAAQTPWASLALASAPKSMC